jgi:hypothetical protein
LTIIIITFVLSVLFAACSSASPAALAQPVSSPTAAVPTNSAPPIQTQPAVQGSSSSNASRTDEQGAVTVEVTPTNLDKPGDTLQFEVSMNTHSVDLSMDLASLATINTDTGKTIQASDWSAPGGGHHVQGTLSFPGQVDGKPVLEGVKQITLVIKDVDAPERDFTWDFVQ